jgi:hypothetical protein
MNPKKLELAEKGYEIAAQRKDIENWQLGIYFSNALISTVGNMFKGKGKAPYEYPKEPMFACKQAMSEEESEERRKERELNELVRRLDGMETTWKSNHRNEVLQNVE